MEREGGGTSFTLEGTDLFLRRFSQKVCFFWIKSLKNEQWSVNEGIKFQDTYLYFIKIECFYSAARKFMTGPGGLPEELEPPA